MPDQARTGPRFLAQPEIAEIIVNSRHQLTGSYEPHAYVVMPNHVHILITPNTALDERLRRRDRYEFAKIVNYIENTPVRAGLVATPGAYCWSSAPGD